MRTAAALLLLALAADRPVWVEEALAYGSQHPRLGFHGPKDLWFSTPFLRVALRAARASKENRRLRASDLSASDTAPDLQILARVVDHPERGEGALAGAFEVQLVLPDGRRLQPRWKEVRGENALLGERVDRWDYRIMIAAFRFETTPPSPVQVEVLYRWDTRDRSKNFTRTYTLELDKVRW